MGKELLKVNVNRQRQMFSKEFKLNAVSLLQAGQKPATQLALELGIRRNLLYKWADNAADNQLDGAQGADSMAGGAGDDTYFVDHAGDTVTENLNEGIDTVYAAINTTLTTNVENLILGIAATTGVGNALDNTIIGNGLNNTLTGAAGNDWLDGGAGTDTMLGGLGDDVYVVDIAGDVVTENANEGADTVQSGITYTLGANVENLTLSGATAINGTGNALANVLTGNSANNTLTGNAGDDRLDGGIGADTLAGGLDNDTYIVDNVADIVTELTSQGTDTVLSSITYSLVDTDGAGANGANVENLTLTGFAAINGTGNALNNTLIGNSGNNTLDGGAGNDILDGASGNDILNGGVGDDQYLFNANNGLDQILDSSGNDKIVFGTGITAAQITASRANGEVTLTVSNGNSIRFADLGSNTYAVEQFQFADGSMQNAAWVSALINTLPDGTDKTLVINEDESYTFSSSDFRFADVDAGDSLSVVRIEHLPTAGSLKLNGLAVTAGQEIAAANIGNLVFTPAANANGTNYASFTFSVKDQYGAFDTTPNTLNFNVAAVNDAPILTAPAAISYIDTVNDDTFVTKTGNLVAADVDAGTTLSYGISGGTDNGTTVSQVNAYGTLTVTKASGAYTFVANDTAIEALKTNTSASFTVTVTDGVIATPVASTLTINLIGANDTAVFAGSLAGSVTEDGTQIATGTLTVTDRDPGDAAITAQTNTLGVYGNFSIASNGQWTYTLNNAAGNVQALKAGQAVTDNFTVNTAGGTTRAFGITINGSNDAPILTTAKATLANGSEDSVYTITLASLLKGFNDADGDTLSVNNLTASASFSQWQAGTLSAFNPATATWTFTPTANFGGAVNLSYTITDGHGGEVVAIQRFTMTRVNDAPYLVRPIADKSILINTEFSYATGVFADVDAAEYLNYTATLADGSALPTWLTFNSATRSFNGVPASSEVGTLHLKVTAYDYAGARASTTFTLNILAENQAPAFNEPTVIAYTNTPADDNFAVTTGVLSATDGDIAAKLAYGIEGVASRVFLPQQHFSFHFGEAVAKNTGNIRIVDETDPGLSVSINVLDSQVSITDNVLTINPTADLLAYHQYHLEVDSGAIYDIAGNIWVGFSSPTAYAFTISPDLVVVGKIGTYGTLTINQTSGAYAFTPNDSVIESSQTNVEESFNITVSDGIVANPVTSIVTIHINSDNGVGNNIYVVNSASDMVTERYNEGSDTIFSSITYSLLDTDGAGANGANVENLTLTGTAAINGTGNTLDNLLIGNAAANTLNSGAGNDTLNGGLGNDILNGDTGNDQYLFNVDSGADQIVDSSGNDRIVFGTGITASQITADRSNGEVTLTVSSGNSIRFAELVAGIYTVEQFQFADGSMQNAAWVSALINTLPDGTDKTLVINEDESYTFSSSDFRFADVDAGDSLSVVRIEHLPTAGSLKLSGLAVTVGQEIAAANIVNLTFTPAANANGTSYASFTFSVKDQYGAFDTTPNTLSLNVTAVNDSPILTTAQATLVNGTEDSSYTITQASLLTGFSDVDGNPLTVTGLTADNGTLSAVNATTQSWTFTPTANFNGTVNLSYNVTDGIANTAATQSFNLAAVNDAPTGNINVTGTRTQGQVLTADATSLADADDLGALSYQWQSSSDGSTWSNISGADSANYTVTATDVGQQVRLQTAYTDGSGNAELINSDAFSIGKLITGTSNNDRLIGTVNDDRIEGLAGYDIINGGTGADAMIGGLGNDGYYVDNIGDIVTENFNEGSDTVYSTVSYSLSANIETLNLIISSGAALSGNTIGNVINGNAGNDTLDGGAGNDYLYGNAGNDTYVFGRGYGSDYISEYDTTAGNIDTVEILSNLLPSDVVVNRYGDHLYLKITGTTEQLTLAKWFSSDAYKVEQIKFADGTIWDVATLMAKCNLGTAGNDQIAGTTGADTMQGGPGNDIYIINHNDDIIIENLNEGLDSVLASVSYTLGANIENLSLTSVIAGTLTGNALNNKLRGWYGDDTLDGGAGNDNLDGNVGNDTYVFGRGYGDDNINDYDSTIGNIDTIQMLSNLLPSDVVVSRDVNQLYLQINGTKDRLILTNWFISDAHKIEQIKFADGTIWDIATLTAKSNLGTTGNDYLAGTTGANTLAGGLGNDTYIVDHSGDGITENLNEGIDRVEASISYTLSANVENLTLTSATAISGTGNELDNYIAGNFASNILDGGAGNDVLKGAGGLDRFVFSNLLGSNNVDTISDFSRGQDKIVLSNAIFTMLLNDTDLSDNIVVSVAGSNALDANDYLIYNSTTKALYYDADGSGAGAAVQFATLTNIATVRATDFVVM